MRSRDGDLPSAGDRDPNEAEAQLEAALDAAIGAEPLEPFDASDYENFEIEAPFALACADLAFTTVGGYTLLDKLGTSSESEIWRAMAQNPDGSTRTVVLRWLREGAFGKSTRSKRFISEAKIGTQLSHRALVRLHGRGEHEGRPYYVREHVEGMNLRAVHEATKDIGLPTPIIVALGHRIASVLAYAHGGRTRSGRPINLIHGEISPSTILISNDGDLKLTELTVSALSGKPLVWRTDGRPGRLGYMSPEQLRGDSIDGASDMFSLGLVLIELIGRRPLVWDGSFALEELDEAAALWCTLRKDMPSGLSMLVRRMTALDPDERPTALETKRTLKQILDGLETRPHLQAELQSMAGVRNEPSRSSAIAPRPSSIAPPAPTERRHEETAPARLMTGQIELIADLERDPSFTSGRPDADAFDFDIAESTAAIEMAASQAPDTRPEPDVLLPPAISDSPAAPTRPDPPRLLMTDLVATSDEFASVPVAPQQPSLPLMAIALVSPSTPPMVVRGKPIDSETIDLNERPIQLDTIDFQAVLEPLPGSEPPIEQFVIDRSLSGLPSTPIPTRPEHFADLHVEESPPQGILPHPVTAVTADQVALMHTSSLRLPENRGTLLIVCALVLCTAVGVLVGIAVA